MPLSSHANISLRSLVRPTFHARPPAPLPYDGWPTAFLSSHDRMTNTAWPVCYGTMSCRLLLGESIAPEQEIGQRTIAGTRVVTHTDDAHGGKTSKLNKKDKEKDPRSREARSEAKTLFSAWPKGGLGLAASPHGSMASARLTSF